MEKYFDLARSFQASVNGFRFETAPFSSFNIPAVFAVVYLLTIFLLRTNGFGMGNKKYQLRAVAIYHNLFLCLLSLIMAIGVAWHIVRWSIVKRSAFYILCDYLEADGTGGLNVGGLTLWCYIFYVSKYYEMLDTVIMVLKGRPLTFIHVYHHFVVPFLFWSLLFTDSTAHWILVLNNSAVHVIMYFYFMIHAMGYTVWWKKYVTIIQIVQFFIDMMSTWPHIITMFFFSPGWSHWSCHGSMPAVVFGQCVGLSFIYLFTSFFFSTYKKDASVMTQFQSVEEQEEAAAAKEH